MKRRRTHLVHRPPDFFFEAHPSFLHNNGDFGFFSSLSDGRSVKSMGTGCLWRNRIKRAEVSRERNSTHLLSLLLSFAFCLHDIVLWWTSQRGETCAWLMLVWSTSDLNSVAGQARKTWSRRRGGLRLRAGRARQSLRLRTRRTRWSLRLRLRGAK